MSTVARRSGVLNAWQAPLDGVGHIFDATTDAPNTASIVDEEDLVEACVEEHSKVHRLKPAARAELTKEAVELALKYGWDPNTFFVFMCHKYKVRPPSITVEYKNLTVKTDALVGSASIPTVGNATVNLLKSLIGMKQRTVEHTILNDVSGVLKPGRITLILGPPSCGKSTFLKVLAGRYQHNRRLRISGDIKYCGHTQNEFVVERTSAFVDQHDNHTANLTVGETLEFAYLCETGMRADFFNVYASLKEARARKKAAAERVAAGEEEPNPEDVVNQPEIPEGAQQVTETMEEEFMEVLGRVWGTGIRVDMTMRFLGLEHTRNTMVGDANVRGVSGGERKRVTTAEMVAGPRQLLLMDEISTGLDSATLYSVITYFAKLTRGLHTTTAITLLQPPPEVFYLFDDLMLMAEGRVVYHGPVKEAVGFFETLGFICPPRKDVPSFLQEVTTASGQHEFANEALKAAKGVVGGPTGERLKKLMTTPEISAAFWDSSPQGKKMKATLDKPYDRSRTHPHALVKKRYALSFAESIVVVTRRSFLLVMRDKTLLVGQMGQIIVMGLIISSLFYQLPITPNAARTFLGAGFMNIMFMAMGAMPQLPTTLATKATWYKFRANYFYSGYIHSFATTISYLPATWANALVYSIITYWMMGFNPQAGAFFTYFLILGCVGTSCSSLFRLIAFVSPDPIIANTGAGISLLILIVLSGFSIVEPSIPHYWIWAYWCSPFSWALRAISVLELTSERWQIPAAGTTETLGYQTLGLFGIFTDRNWIWGAVGFLLGSAILFAAMAGAALQHLPPPSMRARVADEEELEKARSAAHKRKQAAVAASGSLAAARQAVAATVAVDRPGSPSSESAISITVKRTSGTSVAVAARSGQLALVRNENKKDEASASQILKSECPVVSVAPTVTSIPFEPVTLVWQDMRYFVPNPSYKGAKKGNAKDVEKGATDIPEKLELLKGITGYAEPGVLMALMGGSGAGKTTLMDCVAGRKTIGEITGTITVNGHPKVQATWARVMGYVEQMDIHTPSATVIEALMFSARLRLPAEVHDEQVRLYVEEVMDIVELTDIMFDLVGTPGVDGLSTEQRKRLTIGVELVANPAVVFMDEPTSGLDARAAAIVMRAVRNVARNNRAVVVTIHQPSIEIFESFDYLLLLQRGGRTTYFGPLGFQSQALIAYLEAVPGCSPIAHGVNPATWMLEVTGGSMAVAAKAVKADWPMLYTNSSLAANNALRAQELVDRDKAVKPELYNATKFAATRYIQSRELLKKFVVGYWRTPSYNLTRMVQTTAVALIYGSLYFKKGSIVPPTTTASVQNVMGLIYGSTSFMGMTNLMAILPVLGVERVVMYRERAASMYGPGPYNSAVGLVELPYSLAQVTFFIGILYFMVDYKRDVATFFYYWFLTWESTFLFTSFGALLVYITPNQQMAQVLGAAVNFLWSTFNGFVISYSQIPVYWKWLNRISPTTWILYGLASAQLSDNDTDVQFGGDNYTVGSFLSSYFGYQASMQLWCLLILIGFIAGFRAFGLFALKYISFLRR